MSEFRNEPRKRTFLKGRITFNNGASTMDCLIRDMSSTGARLALDQSLTLPDSFDLEIPQKETTFRASLRWRREDGVGVVLNEDKPDGSGRGRLSRLLARVAELEAENRSLKLRLGDIDTGDLRSPA